MSKTIEEEYIELAADYGIDVSVPERFYESQKLLMVRVIKHVHRLDDMAYNPRMIMNGDGSIKPLMIKRTARNERSTDCDMKLTDVPDKLGELLKTFSDDEVNIKSVHNMGNCIEYGDCDEIEGLTK